MYFVKELKANVLKKGKEHEDHGHDADEHNRDGSDLRQLETEGSAKQVDPSEYFDAVDDEDARLEGTSAHHSDALRSGQRLSHAKPDHVENYDQDENPDMSKTRKEKIRFKHIVKIFVGEQKMMTVSPEQLYRVRTMHKKIEDGASFSFNFNTLLMVASILAALGLVSNSSATIIASMLVSPLMGPVVGLAYGTSIRDWKLVRKSLYTGTVSLLYCILTGFVVGCLTGPSELSEDWPTEEMMVRGTTENFYVALPIAFFSGLGVAVSLLDDQTSSLVGVAISASLLPPAVDAGLLWITYIFADNDVVSPTECVANTTVNFNASLGILTDDSVNDIAWINCTEWIDNSDSEYNLTIWIGADDFGNATAERYLCMEWFNTTTEDSIVSDAGDENPNGRQLSKTPFRSSPDTSSAASNVRPEDLCTPEETEQHENEFYGAGAVSLLLTVANIVLIWLSGMLMFRIKEVLPIKKTVFWEDLGIARKVYTHRAVLSRENYNASAVTGATT